MIGSRTVIRFRERARGGTRARGPADLRGMGEDRDYPTNVLSA